MNCEDWRVYKPSPLPPQQCLQTKLFAVLRVEMPSDIIAISPINIPRPLSFLISLDSSETMACKPLAVQLAEAEESSAFCVSTFTPRPPRATFDGGLSSPDSSSRPCLLLPGTVRSRDSISEVSARILINADSKSHLLSSNQLAVQDCGQ